MTPPDPVYLGVPGPSHLVAFFSVSLEKKMDAHPYVKKRENIRPQGLSFPDLTTQQQQ